MRRLTLALLLTVTSLGTVHAAESDVTVVTGIDFGFRNFELDVGPEPDGQGGASFNSSYVMINPNIGIAYRSIYTSLSFDKSIDSKPGVGIDGNSGSVLDFSRSDLTWTFGYRLNPSFSVFAGYTIGNNEFLQTDTRSGNLRLKEITYTETGPFAGIGYSRPVGDNGTLAMSFAYAALDGELKMVDNPGGVDGHEKGDNTGLSYGITWSGSLTGSLGYRVGIKGTRYEMDAAQLIIERYTTFFIGISNYF